MIHWLGLHASTSKDLGSIPGWGIKIPQALRFSQKLKKKKKKKLNKKISSSAKAKEDIGGGGLKPQRGERKLTWI